MPYLSDFVQIPVMNVFNVSSLYLIGLNVTGGYDGGDIFHCELCRWEDSVTL